MPGRTPTEAIVNFLEPMQKTLNYIAVGRLTFGRSASRLRVDSVQGVSFNDADAVPLLGSRPPAISLSSGFWVRIFERPDRREPFSCEIVTYWHAFESGTGDEIIAFHWAPGAGGRTRTYPHLHIGHIVASGGTFMPDRFHKLHVPTSFIPVEAIVRFAIEELGVRVRPGFDRAAVLAELSHGSH